MKMLIIAACLINYADDKGGQAHAQGEFVDVPKDTAKALAEADRALYSQKADDHTKDSRYTADKDMVAAATAALKAASKETAKASE